MSRASHAVREHSKRDGDRCDCSFLGCTIRENETSKENQPSEQRASYSKAKKEFHERTAFPARAILSHAGA
jgi:hypothetical protein